MKKSQNPAPARSRLLGLALVALVALLALAGCTTETEFSLTDGTWQWESFTSGNDVIDVLDPENYTLIFEEDGGVAGQADCNTFAGTYALEDDAMSIVLGPSTLIACGPDSLESTYRNALENVTNVVTGDESNMLLLTTANDESLLFTNPDLAGITSGEIAGLPWWAWLLILLAALLLIWLLLSRGSSEPQPAPVGPATAYEPKTTAAVVDDLTRIEGIGPQIAAVLDDANIRTFSQLSQTSVPELQRILSASTLDGVRPDPTTWPAQARLAAAGKWDELQAMQAGLEGGRV